MSAARSPLRILWTLPYLPWPTTTGGRTRQYALLRQMAMRGHRITLLCLAKDAPDWEGLADLRRLLDDLIVIPRRSRTSLPTLYRAAFSFSRPAAAAVNGCNATYAAAFAALLAQGFDVVQIEHSYSFEPFSKALARRGTPFVLTEHNVESGLTELQYMRLPPPLRVLARLDRLRSRIWERRIIRRAACVIAVSERDRAAFSALGARTAVVAPNCIDTEAFRRVSPDPAARRILFLGNYEYAPNVDAVQRLCGEILPRVWRSHPDAALLLCGHAMPDEWRLRRRDPRVSFTGYVDDLPSMHAAVSLFVAPLRRGGGSKLKVLEAMASALPVVGTAESVSGLRVERGRHYFHGETDEEIAGAIGAALSDPAAAARVGERGRAYVTRHHDWTVAADALERAYAACLAGVGEWKSPEPAAVLGESRP